MFLAIFGFVYLKEKVSLIGSSSIFLAMSGIFIMVGDSISTGSLFGNLVALVIPINFAIYVMIIRKNSNLDMVPAMLYSGIFSLIYGAILSRSFEFTSHDLFMGFLLVSFFCFSAFFIKLSSTNGPFQIDLAINYPFFFFLLLIISLSVLLLSLVFKPLAD